MKKYWILYFLYTFLLCFVLTAFVGVVVEKYIIPFTKNTEVIIIKRDSPVSPVADTLSQKLKGLE